MRLVLAARLSELARIQAYQVGKALKRADPSLTIDYSFRESLGDRNQNEPLWQMPEKGVFTQDFREGLLAGTFDLVVHSWKDLAIENQAETEVVATLPRADARDLFLVRADRWPEIERNGEMSIMTSSPRRSYNLDSFLRDVLPVKIRQLRFVPVRGTVPTRVRKLWETPADGLVVAKAAIDRLLETNELEFAATRKQLRIALKQCRWVVLPLRANPTAPGQGALAIEIAKWRDDLRGLLASINCDATLATVNTEREILRSYGGGCHQKIGANVLQRSFGELTFLRGLTDSGQQLDSVGLKSAEVRPPKIAERNLWPHKSEDNDWFLREVTPVGMPEKTGALWVSRADALPESWRLQPEQIVWTSGLRTWQRLARRGVWVNGCAESLGEQESPNIETLTGDRLNWIKLTHANGHEGTMKSLATYRLVPKRENLELQDKSYFFWSSGSSFEYAISRTPGLRDKTHFCGPGNTQQILLKNGVRPIIFLDHSQWLQEMSANEAFDAAAWVKASP